MTFRNWLLDPIVSRSNTQLEFLALINAKISALGEKLMATLEDVNAALATQFDVLVPSLNTVHDELARLSALVGTGATEEELSEVVAKINENANRAKVAVDALVSNPDTPGTDTPVTTDPLPDNSDDVLNAV